MTGPARVISHRIPVHLLAQVQGLAHKSGKTRNFTVTMLLEVALEEVTKLLSPETLKELDEITDEQFADLDLLPEDDKC